MTFIRPSTGTLFLFEVILMGVSLAFFTGIWRVSRDRPGQLNFRLGATAVVVGAWLLVFSAVVGSGLIARPPYYGLMVLFATSNIVSVGLALGPPGRWLAAGLTPGVLVAFQAFRLPLDWVLHRWALGGTIPTTMTWTGSNWDVVTGVLALVIAPFATKLRGLAWAFNFIGLVLLINVMRVAVMSSPLPFAWGLESPLQLGLHLPYALIVPIAVGGALAGHIILFRNLLQPPKTAW